MGTDATALVQVRDDEGWVEHARFPLARDYDLFALFSDARHPGRAIVPIRAGTVVWPGASLPDPDATWLGLDEVEQVLAAHRGRDPTALREALAAARSLEPRDVRLVFRFS